MATEPAQLDGWKPVPTRSSEPRTPRARAIVHKHASIHSLSPVPYAGGARPSFGKNESKGPFNPPQPRSSAGVRAPPRRQRVALREGRVKKHQTAPADVDRDSISTGLSEDCRSLY